jgi:hypothetical protein
MFWTPAFAGVTTLKTFYEIIRFEEFHDCNSILKSGGGVKDNTGKIILGGILCS